MSKRGRKKIVSLEALNTMYDSENPDALVNKIPPRLVPILERVKLKLPKTLLSDERSIRRFVNPDDRDDRVRLAFWDEYNAATASGKRMSLQSFISGTCSWESWVTAYEPNDKLMCWIFTPPTSYVSQMRHILHRGTERLLEIMSLPMVDEESGKVDVKVANLILRAWQLADMRVKGGVMQRLQIEQKSMNVNLNTDAAIDEMRVNVSDMDIGQLESLEKRLEKARIDSYKFLKGASKDQISMILNPDNDLMMLEDFENRTLATHREALPKLPTLPDLPQVELEGLNDKEK